MRQHGTVVRWNEERGFGFIAIGSGGDQVFVHVSAFPRDGRKPEAGELVSFEVGTGNDGKKRALRVERPGQPVRRQSVAAESKTLLNNRQGIAMSLVSLLVLAAGGVLIMMAHQREPAPLPVVESPEAAIGMSDVPAAFRCDGRTTCSQMTSCAEAEFFLRNCPTTAMDGNNDGESCEQQWCN